MPGSSIRRFRRPFPGGGHDKFELGHVAHRGCDRLHYEGRSGSLEVVEVIFGKRRGCRVEQEGDPGDARRNVLKQLQPLAANRRLRNGEAGDVASRPRQARDKAAADWIGNVRENDGDSTLVTRGAMSLSSSSHLPPIVGSVTVKPVTLPPGRGRPATKPLPTGSATFAKMMGIRPW